MLRFSSSKQPKIWQDQNSIIRKFEVFHLVKFWVVLRRKIWAWSVWHQLKRDKATFTSVLCRREVSSFNYANHVCKFSINGAELKLRVNHSSKFFILAAKSCKTFTYIWTQLIIFYWPSAYVKPLRCLWVLSLGSNNYYRIFFDFL